MQAVNRRIDIKKHVAPKKFKHQAKKRIAATIGKALQCAFIDGIIGANRLDVIIKAGL